MLRKLGEENNLLGFVGEFVDHLGKFCLCLKEKKPEQGLVHVHVGKHLTR